MVSQLSRATPAEAPAAAGGAAIRLDGVTCRFGTGADAVLALDGVDLDVQAGEFLAVVGASGCGKSTLLRLVAGLIRPAAGTVSLGGRPVAGPVAGAAMVFQRPVLLDWRSVLDNVLLPLELAGVATRHGTAERAKALLGQLGLAGFEHRRPRQLSGGMQQRAALARGLITEPAVLLLDEPFSALDAITREQLQEELVRLWSTTGATALLVTHDIAEAVFLADHVAVMTPRPGRVARLFDVPLPRPRPAAIRYDPAAVALCRAIKEAMVGLEADQ